MYMSGRIAAAPMARWSFLTMYRIGNPQGQANAILALRPIDWQLYDKLMKQFAASDGEVVLHMGCIVETVPKAAMATTIETYFLPRTEAINRASIEWQKKIDRLEALEKEWKAANQPPLQTPTSGTPAANAPVAPPSGAAGR